MRLSEAIERLEKLEEENNRLRKMVEELSKLNEQLVKDNKRLHGQMGLSWYSPRKKKGEVTEGETPEESKQKGVAKANENRGAKLGQNRRRKEADEHIHLKLTECPDCGRKIKGKQSEKYSRQVLELLQVPIIKIREYHYYQSHCSNCQKTVCVDMKDQLKAHQYIGPRLVVFISLLRFKLNQSINQTYELINFLTTFELNKKVISKGEIAETYIEVTKYGDEYYQKILGTIRDGPYTHSDETGISVAGNNGYVWAQQSKDAVYYQSALSRGSKIVEETMGAYQGVMVTDYFSGYRSGVYEIQRCWVHLLREVRKIKEMNPYSDQARYLYESLQSIYEYSQGLGPEDESKLVMRVENLIEKHRKYKKSNADVLRIIDRLERHIKELFTFVRHPEVPAHNNAIERSLRTIARYRDGSYCVQSGRGMRALAVGKSLIGTFKLRGEDEFTSLLNLVSTNY